MGHKTQDTLFLIGGAALGAAALYFLDPESGERRRRRVAGATACAANSARRSLGSGWDEVSRRARDITDSVNEHTSDWQHSASSAARGLSKQARGIAGDWTDKARGFADDVSDQASAGGSALRDLGSRIWSGARDFGSKISHIPEMVYHQASHAPHDISEGMHHLGDWWSHSAKDAKRRTGEWLGYKDGFGGGTLTSTAVGCCAVGAGLMYFMDPDRGRARRAWFGDKTVSFVKDTGRTMRSTGRYMANWCRGMMYKTRSTAERMMSEARVDSERLVQRIRAEIGHLSPNFNRMQIMADADGTVTLTGSIVRSEVDDLLTLLHKIPGVSHVINRMTVTEGAQSPSMARM